jgi:hypothetical protein
LARSRSTVATALAALAVLGSVTVPLADPRWCPPPAKRTAFGGAVEAGESFDEPFGPGLVFRLAPVGGGGPGWTIEVRARGDADPERELSWVATPPLRGWNPRYLDASYGLTAAETVARTVREFGFVPDVVRWPATAEAARLLLWPDRATDAELDAARSRLEAAATGRGRFTIRSARLARASDGTERLEALAFNVQLCVP